MYQLYTTVHECEQMLLTSNYELQSFGSDFMLGLQFLDRCLYNLITKKCGNLADSEVAAAVLTQATEILENLQFLFVGLYRARDWHDVGLTVAAVARFFTKKSLGATIDDLIAWCGNQFDVQSSSFEDVRMMFSNYEAVKTSPIVAKLHKLASLTVASCFAQKIGVASAATSLLDIFSEYVAPVVKDCDFVAHLLDTVLFLVERLSQCWATKSLTPLIHSGRSYAAWGEKASLCLERGVLLANPEANGFTYHGFLLDLEECIRQGTEIHKFSKTSDTKDVVSGTLLKLRLLQGDVLTRQAAGEARRAPFAVELYGGSGVGKTNLSNLLFSHYSKMYGLPPPSVGVWTRSAADPFYSGFRTSHWGILLDDIASINPNKGQSDPSLEDVLQIINNTSYCPPQAELEMKGKTPMRPDIVIATTNTVHLNADAWFSNPAAVRRRFPYVVHVAVKSKYAQDHAPTMLDPAKVPVTLTGEYPDIWKLEVFKVEVHNTDDNGRQHVEMRSIHKTECIYDFIKVYSNLVRKFREQQNNSARVKRDLEQIKLCVTCDLPEHRCICDYSTQAEDVPQYDYAAALSKHSDYVELPYATQTGDIVYSDVNVTMPTFTEVPHVEPVVDVERDSSYLWTAGIAGAIAAGRIFEDNIRNVADRLNSSAQRHIRKRLTDYMRKLGHDVFESMITDTKIRYAIYGIGLAITGYAAYKFIRREFKLQAEVGLDPEPSNPTRLDSTGVRPPSAGDETENFYHQKNDYRADMVVSQKTKSWKSLEWTAICAKVANSVVHIKTIRDVGGEKVVREGRAVCVGGRLYVTDNHVIPDGVYTMVITREAHSPGLTTNVTRTFDSSAALRVPEKELVFFQLLDSFDCPDLSDLFPLDNVRTVCKGAIINRDPDGLVSNHHVARAVFKEKVDLPGLSHVLDVWQYILPIPSFAGLCGSPLLLNSPTGPIVVGLHVAGITGKGDGMATCIRKVDVERAREFFFPVFSPAPPLLQSKDKDVGLVALHPKSVFRYLGHGVGRIFGQTTLPRSQPKSSVGPTLMRAAAVKRGYKVNTGAPVMKGRRVWRNNLLPVVEQVHLFKDSVLKKCADAYVEEVLSGLTDDYKSELQHPLDIATAINGVPGRKFIDSINRSTSAGFPWMKTKKSVTSKLPAYDCWQEPLDVNDEVKERMETLFERYDNNELFSPVFIAHIKDEPLPFRKIVSERSRIMNGGPLDFCLAERMYFLPIVRVIQKNPILFESMPGVVAQSNQWDSIYKHLTSFGEDRMVAGDYGKFDKKMGSSLIMYAFYILIKICEKCGMSPTDVNRMWGFAYDTSCSWCLFSGDLVQFMGSNPSGHPLTVIINCLVNCLYLRYCYHELNPDHEIVSFRNNVVLATYGDDNIFGSKVDWFNHSSVAHMLGEHGVEYTMADKESETVPFLHISETSFLKRRWRFEPELGAYVCPIDHATLDKMMTTWIPSGDGPEEHATKILHDVCVEYFWYGREVFEEKRSVLMEIFDECVPPEYLEEHTFPTWDQLIVRWYHSSGLEPPEIQA